MSGSATLATARLRLATAATRISASSTIDARSGASEAAAPVGADVVVIALSPDVGARRQRSTRHARTRRPLRSSPCSDDRCSWASPTADALLPDDEDHALTRDPLVGPTPVVLCSHE